MRGRLGGMPGKVHWRPQRIDRNPHDTEENRMIPGWRGVFALAATLPVAAGLVAPSAMAQTYPAKPIRATIGTPTGGPGDVVLRGAGQAVQDATGQSFIVENRVSVSGI